MVFLSTLLISMFVTMALIPILRTVALRLHAGLDIPNPRKVHTEPKPKVGGLAMAVGALVPFLLVADGDRFVNSVLIGACIIVLFGLLDDIYNLGWKTKFAGQTVAALVVIFFGGLKICFLGTCLPEGVLLMDPLALPITLIVIVGVTNAINLADGLDGLAGGVSLLIFVAIGFLCYSNGDFAGRSLVMLLCISVVGAIFGFLRYNTYPASVFMGDTGSQLLGFLAITLSLGITQQSTAMSPILPLVLLGFPVLDTLTVMVERITAGRPPFAPDKNHFHHKLMRLGLFHTEAVVVIYAVTAVLAVAAVLLRYHSEWLLIGAYLSFCCLVLAAFTALEKRQYQFHRSGFFDLEIKGRLKVIKDKQLPIRICFPVVAYGLPLLTVLDCLVPAKIPGYMGAAAAGGIAVILLIRLMRSEWTANVLRAIFYLTVPLILWAGQAGPAAWAEGRWMSAFRLAPGVLALFTVLTQKLTRRKKGFKPTPMDFLVVLIALVVPNLPEPAIQSAGMGALAATIIVMFFGLEVLLGELRGEIRKLAVGVMLALAVLAVRSVV
jgi:UDP-GlcNAc:undecaprenyl-phosphate/decaprenyl-phosphate GlcNAc-1-phosphate transferase